MNIHTELEKIGRLDPGFVLFCTGSPLCVSIVVIYSSLNVLIVVVFCLLILCEIVVCESARCPVADSNRRRTATGA